MEERALYPSVITWFNKKLKAQHRGAGISVFDTSKTYLWRFLRDEDLDRHFPDYLTYEIQVDITAVIKRASRVELAFIECKINDLTLRDISQLLGYSRVANPITSILLSPGGVSRSVHQLLNVYRRYDVLQYAPKRRIRVCRWDLNRNEIDVRYTLPPGEHV